ncbi:hypothetical protein BDZ91DRAFT_823267 [Kalaharituber pfeilii]|nr:hypothetical protein BDZ91DRAFT_823267 [Kalaharituber pfeilii]
MSCFGSSKTRNNLLMLVLELGEYLILLLAITCMIRYEGDARGFSDTHSTATQNAELVSSALEIKFDAGPAQRGCVAVDFLTIANYKERTDSHNWIVVITTSEGHEITGKGNNCVEERTGNGVFYLEELVNVAKLRWGGGGGGGGGGGVGDSSWRRAGKAHGRFAGWRGRLRYAAHTASSAPAHRALLLLTRLPAIAPLFRSLTGLSQGRRYHRRPCPVPSALVDPSSSLPALVVPPLPSPIPFPPLPPTPAGASLV